LLRYRLPVWPCPSIPMPAGSYSRRVQAFQPVLPIACRCCLPVNGPHTPWRARSLEWPHVSVRLAAKPTYAVRQTVETEGVALSADRGEGIPTAGPPGLGLQADDNPKQPSGGSPMSG
jgi:hypothetical protein